MVIKEEKHHILDWLEENTPKFTIMSEKIWEKPEIMWEEYFASSLQADFLEGEGFRITRAAGDMETAFIAEWGDEGPVLAFIGEYDALPGLSQKLQAIQEAIVTGGHGHGCGHNMLGTASVAAVVAVQKWLQRSGVKGVVRYYGCPAEEGGGGKVFMARAGLFDDLDAALTWHPSSANKPNKSGTVAILSSNFKFKGTSSHAGSAPHLGRSALDAVELMNVAANYLREHVTEDVRIQYVITNGGQAANIVPETAEVHYVLRAEKTDYLQQVHERLRNIARGAALMTDTSFEEYGEMGYTNLLSNHYLADRVYEAMELIGPIAFTEEEIGFAQTINDSFPGTNEDYIQQSLEYLKPPEELANQLKAVQHLPLIGENFPAMDANLIHRFATDVGDLSQVTPTAAFTTATFTTGSPGHSWSNVATGGMSIGHKAMMHAAKTMALTAVDLLTNPDHLQKAREEFEQRMKGQPYKSLLPDSVQPPKKQNRGS